GAYLLSGVALYVTQFILIFLWSMLFVIPGILAALRYSQAFYVLADDPEARPMDCIRRSKELMYGNKGKFVLLLLSFLPWIILASIPAGIARSQLIGPVSYYDLNQLAQALNEASMNPLVVLLTILTLFVQVYVLASTACFYDLAAGNLVVEHGDVTYDGYIADSVDRYEITGFESKYKDDQEE
ncbi:MAG: DUF975 family protein, partial [Firmicutes bacterium]|nr:DUF975 family protein [Bacillota bacterium]